MKLRYRFLHRAGRMYYWLVTPAHDPDRCGFTHGVRVDDFWRAS